ncbi:hypothetical protein AFIC_001432 [[Pseudomonas] carboxydohydrogena]|uniref:Uncharacterized protein n=1 Tax=Afipia carboxydohydrogena TaxID=290 RepID=A0ABY8BUC4_AFICR|nr:hypothetical protein [[Pseudomonas] carboxydohydrogena]WEF52921.1 hypothetical protein AFIC_001432 [[Pseudomonas] carboxydohydrogena]
MPPRRDRSTEHKSEQRGEDGGAEEAATFISETLLNLTSICQRHRFDTLGYLLDMARMEADGLMRTQRKSGS